MSNWDWHVGQEVLTRNYYLGVIVAVGQGKIRKSMKVKWRGTGNVVWIPIRELRRIEAKP